MHLNERRGAATYGEGVPDIRGAQTREVHAPPPAPPCCEVCRSVQTLLRLYYFPWRTPGETIGEDGQGRRRRRTKDDLLLTDGRGGLTPESAYGIQTVGRDPVEVGERRIAGRLLSAAVCGELGREVLGRWLRTSVR